MTDYSFTAISGTGERIAGQIEARSREAVIGQLEQRGAYVVDVVESAGGRGAVSRGRSAGGWFSPSVSRAQVTLATRELAMLLKAGLALPRALALLEADAGSAPLRRLIAQLRAEIEDGRSFSEALAADGRAFPPSYTGMIAVAEASGTLGQVLERIAQTREREQKLRAKILSAALYPAFLIVTAIGAISVMLLFVVPQFKRMLATAGAPMPDAAGLVIGASDWLIANGGLLAAGLGALVAAILLARRAVAPRAALDALAFKLPLIGHLKRLGLTIRFNRSLGTLLENGVALPVALKLTRDVIANRAAGDVIGEAHDALRKGQEFTVPLARSGLLMPVAINMLKVGQETGNLAQSCNHLAAMFEDKLETAVARLFTIVEPLVIIAVSLFVAGIIVSIIGAVISVNDLAL